MSFYSYFLLYIYQYKKVKCFFFLKKKKKKKKNSLLFSPRKQNIHYAPAQNNILSFATKIRLKSGILSCFSIH